MKKSLMFLSSVSLLLAAIALCVFILPADAYAAEITASGTCGENLTWTLDNTGTLAISGEGPMKDYSNEYDVPWSDWNYRISEVIISKGVSKIGDLAFIHCTYLASVTIPESVTSIGGLSFYNCINLTQVNLPNSVASIGNGAFQYCENLENITIPDGIISIGSWAFSSCRNLKFNNYNNAEYLGNNKNPYVVLVKASEKNITSCLIHQNTRLIYDDAFNACADLCDLTISNSVISIGDSAFENCRSLTNVTIGDSVTTIGRSAFSYCTSLENITIPNTVTTIGDSAFHFCWNLSNVTIPESVIFIGQSAFERCEKLKSITIPCSVTNINSYTFMYCESLAEITIPPTLISVGAQAFHYCDNLADVYFDSTLARWEQISIGTGNAPLISATLHSTLYETHIHYPVVFKDWDGSIISSKTYHYGDNVKTPANPARTADKTYTYTFAGWDKEVVNCSGNATYTATYTPTYIDYTVIFVDEDGTEILKEICHWGDEIVPPEDPTKQPDNIYTYIFAGWDKEIKEEVVKCTGNAVYIATYEKHYNKYLVAFWNWNGYLLGTNEYHWGEKVTPPASTPFREPDNTYFYEFAGWDKEIVDCAGNANYTATYKPIYRDYTVEFRDWNGAILSTNTYHWGDKVVIPNDPVRAADNTYTYTFNAWENFYAEWDELVVSCAGNATYIATYVSSYIDYTVVFKNWEGTVISTGSYHWGDIITVPATPVREKDDYYIYTFSGWDKEVVNCEGNAIYQAVFTSEHYHTYAHMVAGPTCAQQGYATHTCACGDNYVDSYVNALGHSFTSYKSNNDATCTADGTETAKCDRCTVTDTRTETGSAKGHSHNAVVTAPTCTQQGYTTHTCACGNSYVDSYVNVLGHSFTSYKSNSNATCTADGTETAKCDRCTATDTRTEVDSAKGHHHNAVVTAPTCIQRGYTTHTCYCGDSYVDTYVAATGHTYVPTVVKPTPSAQGYTLHTCHCGDSYKNTYVPALDMSAPKVTITLDAATDKPVLSWKNAGEGVIYEIHRATSKSGKYTKVATVAESSWIDTSASVGKTYYYKVKVVYAEDTSLNSDFSEVVSATAKCAAPAISVENDSKGKPKLTWEKVSGAKKYTVYRATSENGKYTKLSTTTKTYYTDSKAKAGTTYFYKIIANASSSKYHSGYSNIVSCGVICGTPSVTVKIDSNTGKPSLSWGKVDGAAKYAIYRDGELLTTVTAVTYADTTAAIDTRYSYAVQALGKTESLNGAISEAVTATSGIAKPAAKGSVDTISGKPVITWQAVEGAVKYEIYRSTSSSKSYKLVETVEELTYTDETVSAGKTYYYKVKAIGAVSKSADSSYVKLTGKCATPVISVSNDAKGKPYITWEKISGAKKYTVYRATSETGKYTKLGTTTKVYYTDSKASAGKTYFYKIIANASSSKNNSPYSNIVSCGVNCATPVVKVTNNASGKPVLSWSKVSGAAKYEIYLLGAEDYVVLGTVTGTTWTDEGCAIGEGRYYGVRAIAAEEAYNSEVSQAVFARATCATPKATGKVGENKKPVITWAEVDGATKYVVYRSTSKSKGYKIIGESETLTYEDLTATKGKTYYYKVVAVGENCESAQSSYVKVKSK